MRLQVVGDLTTRLFQQGLRTQHRRMIMFSLLLAACYLPNWLGFLGSGIIQGRSDAILNIGFIVLGLRTLLQNRRSLRLLKAASDDRCLGYSLILGGAIGFIIFHSIQPSISFQALTITTLLLGVAWSTWGLEFFQKFPLTTLLIALSTYPKIPFIAVRFFRFFTSENMLEVIMAWAGSLGLRLIGYSATFQHAYVRLPEGAVEVAPGCSGFDMAFILAGMGFLMGQLMNQSWKKTIALCGSGICLALLLNIPRIMLLAIASVYWGKDSFEFWHGPIGGQIFASVLFTVYYYVAMWIIDRGSKPRHS